jgi:hypothetical protein
MLNVTFFPYIWGGKSIADSTYLASIYGSGSDSKPLPNNDVLHFVDAGSPAWFMEPLLILDREIIFGKHEAPLWNPYLAYGSPLAANMSSQPYSPFAWITFAIPNSEGYNIFVLLRLYAAGLFMLLFLRRFLDLVPALVGAIAFMYTGYFVSYLTHPQMSVEVLVPALLLACELVLRSPSRATVAFFAVAFACAVLGGMPESTLLAVLFAVLYFAVRLVWTPEFRSNLRPILTAFAAGTALSGALCAILLLPFVEYVPHSFNIHVNTPDGLYTDQVSYDDEMIRLMPLIHGPIWNDIFTQFTGGNGTRGFFGTSATLLALIGLVSRIRKRSRLSSRSELPWAFFLATAAVLLLKQPGFPIVQWIGALPIVSMVQFVKYEEAVLGCAVAALAAYGASRLIQGLVSVTDAAISLIIVLTLVSIEAGVMRPAYSALTGYQGYYIGAMALCLCVLVGFAALIAARAWNKIPTNAFVATLVAIVFVEANVSWVIPMLYVATTPGPLGAAPFERGAPFVSYLQAHLGNDRFLGEDALLFPDWSAPFEIQDVRDLDALYPARYFPFIQTFFTPHDDDANNRFNAQTPTSFRDPFQRRFLTLSSIRYIATQHPIGDQLSILASILDDNQDRAGSSLRGGTFDIAGVSKAGAFVHPPQPGVGGDVRVPSNASRLLFSIGMLPQVWKAPTCGDGVNFSVSVRGARASAIPFRTYIDPKHRASERRWLPQSIDVRALRGQTAHVTIGTAVGPSGSTCADWAVFGDMRFDVSAKSGALFEQTYGDAKVGVSIYRYAKPLARLSAFRHVTYVADGPAALARIKAKDFDPAREVIVEGANPHTQGMSDAPQAFVPGTLTSYEPNRVSGSVDLAGPSIVMLNDTFYPGWKAFVDDVEVPIVHADYLFRGIVVNGGTHRIEFRYDSSLYTIGRDVTILGVFVLLAIAFVEIRVSLRKVRPNRPTAGHEPQPAS